MCGIIFCRNVFLIFHMRWKCAQIHLRRFVCPWRCRGGVFSPGRDILRQLRARWPISPGRIHAVPIQHLFACGHFVEFAAPGYKIVDEFDIVGCVGACGFFVAQGGAKCLAFPVRFDFIGGHVCVIIPVFIVFCCVFLAEKPIVT